jgi:hypothetical protein
LFLNGRHCFSSSGVADVLVADLFDGYVGPDLRYGGAQFLSRELTKLLKMSVFCVVKKLEARQAMQSCIFDVQGKEHSVKFAEIDSGDCNIPRIEGICIASIDFDQKDL